MKKELPIAAGLLALGVALCWNVSSTARGQASVENAPAQSVEVLANDVATEPAAAFLNTRMSLARHGPRGKREVLPN